MKNCLLLSLFVASSLFASATTVEKAYKQGTGFAAALNMQPGVSMEQKKEQCKTLVESSGLLGVDNRDEMLSHSIRGCKESLR